MGSGVGISQAKFDGFDYQAEADKLAHETRDAARDTTALARLSWLDVGMLL